MKRIVSRHPTAVVKQATLRLGLLVALVLVVSACGAETGKPFSEQFSSIEPSRYHTTEFEPALAFEVGGGWTVHVPEEPTVFTITRRSFNELTFASPQKVFDPNDPDELVPAPQDLANWISWFREHPYLRTSPKLESESIGGVEGQRLEMTVSSPLDYDSESCGSHVPIYPVRSGSDECFLRQDRTRIIVSEVEGEAVLVIISATEGELFEGFVPQAREVLDTVEWEGT
jgi:hypothetical protein